MPTDSLVILPGWGGKASRWQPLVGLVTARVKTRVEQMPQDKVRNTEAFADWLYQKTRSLKPFYLLGHSFGGQIALNFASRYPKRVKKLILVGSAGIRRPSLKSRLLLPLAKLFRFAPLQFKRLAYRLIRETDYVKANPIMKETMKLILKEDQQQAMKKIAAPTLIVWGKGDRYTPLWQGRLIKRLIKNSRWAELEGGHGLPFTHARQLAEKILWFLK